MTTTIDLMNRLHALDAALAACERLAIDVDELRAVWERHYGELAGVAGSDGPWVEELLARLAERHGILGLVSPPPGSTP